GRGSQGPRPHRITRFLTTHWPAPRCGRRASERLTRPIRQVGHEPSSTRPDRIHGRAGVTTTIAVPRRSPVVRFGRIALFAVAAIVIYQLVLFVALTQTWLVGTSALPADQAFPVAVQQTINALSIGAIYALIALGYTMVYGIIELINFAHGDVFMVGAFL